MSTKKAKCLLDKENNEIVFIPPAPEGTNLGGVSTAEKATWNGKANKPTSSSVMMASTNWSNSEYSFEASYPSATYDISIELSGDSATDEQVEAWSAAKLCGSVTANKVIAKGDTPTIDIPVIVKVVEK